MVNLTKCRWCNGDGHLLEDCPQRAKPIAKLGEVARVKKAWVKPELRVYRREKDVDMSTKDDVVSTDKKELRRQQQREWVKKKREANRIG